jgi:PAS domain S-box-containing protein
VSLRTILRQPYAWLSVLIIVMTLVALVVGGIMVNYLETRLVATTGESLSLAATEIADKLDRLLFERYGDVQMMSRAFSSKTADRAYIVDYLQWMKKSYPVYMWLGVSDQDGRIIAASDARTLGKDLSRTAWFRSALRSRGTHVSDVAPYETIGGVDAVAFTAPILGSQDEFLGVVTTRIALPALEDVVVRTIRALHARGTFLGGIEYQFLRQDGLAFVDSDLLHKGNINLKVLGLPSARLSETGVPGYVEEMHLRRHLPVVTGYARTQGYHEFRGLQWAILVRIDRRDILMPIYAMLFKLGVAGAAVWLPMFALLLWSTRSLRRGYLQAKQEERRRRAQYAVTRVLAEAPALTAAAPKILQAICDSLQWEVGLIWTVDLPNNVLHCMEIWHTPGSHVTAFELTSRQTSFAPGIGLPGRVWASRQPAWIPDVVQDKNFPRAPAAAQVGLHGALGFPVMSGGSVVAVLEFFSHQIREPDLDLLQMLGAIGIQIGQFIERKQAEAAFRQIQQRFRGIYESSKDAIGYASLDGRLLDVNDSFAKLTGYTRDEALTKTYQEITPAEYHALEAEIVQHILKTGEPAEYEKAFVRKDGKRVAVVLTVFVVNSTEGRPSGIAAIIKDMTQRKQLEQQFLQAQKMEAVGKLAGGVAHDFNNLLTVILSYTELLLKKVRSTSASRGFVEEIRAAAKRAAALTQQLLAFSRKQMLEPKVLDLNSLISDLEGMLRPLVGEAIDLVSVLAPRLGRIKADPSQLEQVIMNLVINARDAMPEGGQLTIETANVELTESHASKQPTMQLGPYVMLTVTDTGCGMNAETLSHIFEPFFTTKEPGQGTGLGLSTVYGIVKQSGGSIWVYSEEGEGTTFKIYLPRVRPATQRDTERLPGHDLEGVRGKETILLVEDEPVVRALIKNALNQHGYFVLDTQNGMDALRVGTQYAGQLDLLITDVIMPQMSGREVAHNLALIFPDLKILFISGFTDDAIVRHGVLEKGSAFLQKPFTPDVLLRKVRTILDSA